MFNEEVDHHLQRAVHLNIRKTSPWTGKLLLFLSIFSYLEGTLLLIVSYFKVPNSSIFHSIISADRAFIVDILLNRADSELVILS